MRERVTAAFLYSDGFTSYDFGPHHPLRPERLRLARGLLQAYGVLDRPEVQVVEACPAREEEVLLIHSRDYYEAVAAASAGQPVKDAVRYGFSVVDNPPFPGMLEASLLYTGASLQAARLVSAGEVPCAFNLAGGLHHAMASRASGFCIFNDPAIAIADLLKRHERVLYLDIDAHHGDGVEAAFRRSSRVLTISIHESGRFLFPGTGFPEEIGEGEGAGYSVNAPLFPGTGDDTFIRVFDALVPPLVDWFQPDVVVAQLGVDTHRLDPLAHLSLTTRGFLHAVQAIRDWGRPLVALGGGGYNPGVVARAWTLAFGCLARVDLPDTLPPGQAHLGEALRDHTAPAPQSGGPAEVEAFADATIAAVKQYVFERHGIRS